MTAFMAETALVPDRNCTVYLVLDDFGPHGRAYRETDENRADRHTVLANLMAAEYERPLRIIAFNAGQGWTRDVTAEIAREVERRLPRDEEPSLALCNFLDRATAATDKALGSMASCLAAEKLPR